MNQLFCLADRSWSRYTTLQRTSPSCRKRKARGQGAIKALMLVAEYGGPTMMARIGMMRALNHRGSPKKS